MGRPPSDHSIAIGRVRITPSGDQWRLRWTDAHGYRREHRAGSRDAAIAAAGRIDGELTAAGVPPAGAPARPRTRAVVLGPRDRLADVTAAALNPAARPSWGRKHTDRLSSLARCHLIPTIGDLPCDELLPAHWAKVLTGMQDAGYQGSTIKGVYDLMKLVVDWGRHHGVWGPHADPLYGVSLPKAAAVGVRERTGRISRNHVPSHAQCDALYAALADRPRWQLGARLAAKTGIRMGELLAVGTDPKAANCFDPARRELHIDWQWSQYDDGSTELTLPKHDKRRIVVVPGALADDLAAALEGGGRLISDRKGGVPHRSNVSRRILRPAMDAAGWPSHLTWHSLRHRAAVDMVNALKLADASAMLGHATPAFTLARYVGIDDDHLGRVRDTDW